MSNRTIASHYADLINRVYGSSTTLNWGAPDLRGHLRNVKGSDWKDGREVITFTDGSAVTVAYGYGVTLTPCPTEQEQRMERMKSRLADLLKQYEDAEAFGWGEGILGQIRSDISWQRRAIEQAGR